MVKGRLQISYKWLQVGCRQVGRLQVVAGRVQVVTGRSQVGYM